MSGMPVTSTDQTIFDSPTSIGAPSTPAVVGFPFLWPADTGQKPGADRDHPGERRHDCEGESQGCDVRDAAEFRVLIVDKIVAGRWIRPHGNAEPERRCLVLRVVERGERLQAKRGGRGRLERAQEWTAMSAVVR